LPVLRPDGPCPKRSPERYAREASALVLELSDALLALFVSNNPEAVQQAASILKRLGLLKNATDAKGGY